MPNEVVPYLIRAGLGVLCGLVPLIYCLKLKNKKLAAIYMLFCVVITAVSGLLFGAVMAALCVFWTYRNHKKFLEAQEKKNRIAYQKKLEEEQKGSVYIDEKKARSVWPPINNAIVDPEAAREFQERVNDVDSNQ